MPSFIRSLLQYFREDGMPSAKAVATETAQGESRIDATKLLDDALLREVVELVGERSFRNVAGISPRFRRAYQEVFNTCTTSAEEMVSTVSGAELFCQEASSESRFRFDKPELYFITGPQRPCRPFEFVGKSAALNGRLDILQWAVARGYPLKDPATARFAAHSGDLQVLRWIFIKKRGRRDWRSCAGAALGGHLTVLQWAHANGCPWDEYTCYAAASTGHLNILQRIRGRGCAWNTWTCASADGGGHLHVLKLARLNGCPWNRSTCISAAEGGHLAILQWARANGCPWDEDTCRAAARNGHLAVLEWARANGCPE